MRSRLGSVVFRELSRVRPGVVPLLVITVLLGVANWLVINQRVMLYVFYLPIVFAAWILPRRDALGVAMLAAVMVIGYAFFLPEKLDVQNNRLLLWTELTVWGGILVVTAYLVCTLRGWTEEAVCALERAYGGVLAVLSKFIETVDADTEAHCVRVSAWAVRIAEELGLSRLEIEEIRIAGLLHDVGKVDVSVELLRKAAALSQVEQEQIREHAARGAAMVKPLGGMLSRIADAIEAHHEKFDGTGYSGLRGEAIPLAARVVAVADAFDAMLSDRPYRKGMGICEASDNLGASSGSHFDPRIVTALQKIVNREGEQALAGGLTAYARADVMIPAAVERESREKQGR